MLVNTKSSLKYGCFILFLMGSMLAWNVCGLGGRDKRRVLRNVIRKNNIDFICVLETKLEIVDEKIVNAVWGREHRSWYALPSLGLSGGVLCIWNHSNFCVNSSYVEFNSANLGIETQNLFIYLQL